MVTNDWSSGREEDVGVLLMVACVQWRTTVRCVAYSLFSSHKGLSRRSRNVCCWLISLLFDPTSGEAVLF